MKTRDLINALVEDGTVSPARPELAVALALLAGLIIPCAILIAIGVRPQFGIALETVRFPFKIILSLVLAVSATGLVLRFMRPDAASGKWTWAMLAAPVLLAFAVLSELMATPASSWPARLIGANALSCLLFILIMASGPLACFLIALRQGAPAKPELSGAIAGLAAGGLAASVYALHCTDDSPLFVAVWYSLAVGAVTLTGWLAGRRWLKW